MNDPNTANDSMLKRLEALECANERLAANYELLKRAALGGLAFVCLLLIGGAAVKSLSTLEGSEFVLRDKANRMRAALAIRPDGTPGLGLFDEAGKIRLSLELSPQGTPGVNLLNATGSLAAAVAIRPDGTPGVGLFDARGNARASLDVNLDGTSGVNVFDQTGTLRAALAIKPDGNPGVGLFNPAGEVVENPANEAGREARAEPKIQ